MPSELKLLAFDLGAESGRAVVGLLEGSKLRLEEVHRFANGSVAVGDSLYWDVLRLFTEMKHGFRVAVQSYGKDIAGVGIDTWGVDFALLGPDDILLENPHCYRDSRNDGMIEEAEKVVPRSEIYEDTGIQLMPFNTIFQLLAITRRNRWLLDTTRTMLMMPDLFNFWFTGVKVGEFTDVTTSQCYNPRTGDWARALLERLNIPTHFLPEIVPPGTILGSLHRAVSEEVGTSAPLLIAPATHDTGSAVAAVPATGRSYAYISSGTWSLMGVELPEPIINDTSRTLNFTNEGGVAGTYRVLKNIAGLWLIQECRRTWQLAGSDYTYAQLTEMATKALPFQSIIDPDDPVFAKPGDMPFRIRDYCSRTHQPIPQDESSVVRTVLDSLALRYRWVLEKLEAITGQHLEPIHIVGGGTRNQLLCQLAADVTNRPVVAGPAEATAIGNLLVQAMGLGHIASIENAREIVRCSSDLVIYEPRHNQSVEDAYSRFSALVA